MRKSHGQDCTDCGYPLDIMTADERIELVQVKIKRAKEHVANVYRLTRAFIESRAYGHGTKRDPRTGELLYYVTRAPDKAPSEISAVAGDAIQNLRSALDHLACSLVLAAGGKPHRNTGFPIHVSATEYEYFKRRKVQGMSKAAIEAIDALKPYKGGNDTLWLVHRLNNIDKHRLLITVGTMLCSHTPTPTQWRHLASQGLMPPLYLKGRLRKSPFMRIQSPAAPVYLKTGEILLRDAPDAEVDQEIKFSIDVAFNEPGICEGQPVFETLKVTTDRVNKIVLDFRPLLG